MHEESNTFYIPVSHRARPRREHEGRIINKKDQRSNNKHIVTNMTQVTNQKVMQKPDGGPLGVRKAAGKVEEME